MEELQEIKIEWCKVFTLPNGSQVLATKDYDSEDEKYLINIEVRFEFESAMLTQNMKMSYSEEDKRDEKFIETDINIANSAYNSFKKQLQEMLS